jgi:nucleoside-diphosphate-sugar epimerase
VPDARALIVGITGISGRNLAEHLLAEGWDVTGISRHAPQGLPDAHHVHVDLTNGSAVDAALRDAQPTHVFFCTWSRRPTEAENVRVNAGMLRNVLSALEGAADLRHVALVTGLKHYLGPFESYGKEKPETPFREEQPRLPYENFYYAQEDVLWEAADRRGFTWSVHRPHTMIGWALGNAMNMGVTLALYGVICRETGRPFVFPGSRQQWEGVTDITDARLLARQLAWAATTPGAANQAFNVVNGDVFRWRRMWRVVARGLGVDPAPYPGRETPLEQQMKDAGPIWDDIVERHGLQPHKLDALASWWHSDADLSRPLETFTDMGKSRRFGFLDYQDSERSFLDLFDRLRSERIIPALSAAPARTGGPRAGVARAAARPDWPMRTEVPPRA